MRENAALDTVNRHFCSSAVGLGQTTRAAFFHSLGISKNLIKLPRDATPTDCVSKQIPVIANGGCPGVNPLRVRSELYRDYQMETPNDLYRRLAYDVDLQARAMVGSFLNNF